MTLPDPSTGQSQASPPAPGSGRLLDPREEPEEFDRLVNTAHRDAQVLLDRDPELSSDRGKAALMLLALFGHDPTMAKLDAG